MHVLGIAVDLNWLIRFVVTAFIVALGLLQLVRNTASKYFTVDADFEDSNDVVPAASNRGKMSGIPDSARDACAICGKLTKKQCSGCKLVKYCSESCQKSHWVSEHKAQCKNMTGNVTQAASAYRRKRASNLFLPIPNHGSANIFNQSNKILFPYEDFVKLFNWDKPGFTPCGLLNCGNSCFANVVLQCLAYTRPLVAYLFEKGHRAGCRRNDWCFLCEFEVHVERSSHNLYPFSPVNILSRLRNIGGNLGYGRQEDAHEFMRFAIDTMQSVCLDEFGGEKAVPPSSAETTLIQHIFGGHLQSQVICTKCNNISSQFENMMDLTVEIHGDAASLEECLDQFTAKEWLDGDNKYKCDGCNEYVLAWKRLTIRHAPNVLTIALKRFQSGRFGKLNKRVTFPETLDLSPYMSQPGDGNDVYKLYGVVVHVDMLNASFFGHYICYIKDFLGNWYVVDDCKVQRVELDDVLSQGAYMLLYNRVCARSSSLFPGEHAIKGQETVKADKPVEYLSAFEFIDNTASFNTQRSHNVSVVEVSGFDEESSSATDHINASENEIDAETSSSFQLDDKYYDSEFAKVNREISRVEDANEMEHGVGSVTDTCNSKLDLIIQPHASVSDAQPTKETIKDTKEECLLSGTIKEPVTSEFHVFEKSGKDLNGSIASSSSGQILNNMVSVNSECNLEKVEPGKVLLSSSGVKDATSRVGGKDAKLKPLFAPGFLGRSKRGKVINTQEKSAAGHNESVFPLNLSNQETNGFSKPVLCHQNHETEVKEMSESNGDVLSPDALKKQSGTCSKEDAVVTVEPIGLMKFSNSDSFTQNNNDGARGTEIDMDN